MVYSCKLVKSACGVIARRDPIALPSSEGHISFASSTGKTGIQVVKQETMATRILCTLRGACTDSAFHDRSK
jgi:hypothetical protein